MDYTSTVTIICCVIKAFSGLAMILLITKIPIKVFYFASSLFICQEFIITTYHILNR